MTMRPITDNEAKLIAALLDMAGREFANHVCNDFVMSDHVEMSPEELVALDLDVHVKNGDPHEHEPESVGDYQSDFCLMFYLASRVREAHGIVE